MVGDQRLLTSRGSRGVVMWVFNPHWGEIASPLGFSWWCFCLFSEHLNSEKKPAGGSFVSLISGIRMRQAAGYTYILAITFTWPSRPACPFPDGCPLSCPQARLHVEAAGRQFEPPGPKRSDPCQLLHLDQPCRLGR